MKSMQSPFRWSIALVPVLIIGTACAQGSTPVEIGSNQTLGTGATTASSEPSSTTTSPGADSVTTTTSAPSETTSTVAATTSTTSRAAASSSPVYALDSFRWDFSTAVRAASEQLLSVRSSGTYVDGDIDCRITTALGAFSVDTAVIIVGDDSYYDAGDGAGAIRVPSESTEVERALLLCAGSEAFWADITGGEELPGGGSMQARNGLDVRQVELAGIVDQAGRLGLVAPGVDGLRFDELTFWVVEPGDWVSAVEMRADLDSETLNDITGADIPDGGSITVDLEIVDPDDPDLTVGAP
jgi:hypothetical protein